MPETGSNNSGGVSFVLHLCWISLLVIGGYTWGRRDQERECNSLHTGHYHYNR